MHAILAAPECASYLARELPAGAATAADGDWLGAECLPAPPVLAFARQVLPNATTCSAATVSEWADALLKLIFERIPPGSGWRLHVWPAYGSERAGEFRCKLIRETLIKKLKKTAHGLLKRCESGTGPFGTQTSLVQAALTAPDAGWISACAAPEAYELRAVVSSFEGGEVPVAEDKAAPSRAFSKLVEAEARLGRQIAAGESCVDLGAAPGSWTYVAAQRGARVVAVDRSALREDLMASKLVRFQQGDAFKYVPTEPVDWLLCDVIAAPQRSMNLLQEWLAGKRMRRFVVTLKFKGDTEYGLLEELKRQAAPLCRDFRLTHLCANKNEVCAYGEV